MALRLISGDNHIDLTYCPRELWASAAPHKWKLLVPQVEEMDDGLHWFVEGRDVGLWNGLGPTFNRYTRGYSKRRDAMVDAGFSWDNGPQAIARPVTPELRLQDLDRDGQYAEVVYGCLMINDLIADPQRRAWACGIYNDWAADFARRSDPKRIFPLAMLPNTDPTLAANEVRRCAALGLRGGDLAVRGAAAPLYHPTAWDPLWAAAAECRFPISFHSTGFRGLQGPGPQDDPRMPQWRYVFNTLFQLDGMMVLTSLIASGACERFPELKFVLGEAGVTWIPYILDRMDVEYEDKFKEFGFSLKPSDYFRRQGYTTYQQDAGLELFLPAIGEDNVIWGCDYPHADCLWPESRQKVESSLAGLSERARRKIAGENAAALYGIV